MIVRLLRLKRPDSLAITTYHNVGVIKGSLIIMTTLYASVKFHPARLFPVPRQEQPGLVVPCIVSMPLIARFHSLLPCQNRQRPVKSQYSRLHFLKVYFLNSSHPQSVHFALQPHHQPMLYHSSFATDFQVQWLSSLSDIYPVRLSPPGDLFRCQRQSPPVVFSGIPAHR